MPRGIKRFWRSVFRMFTVSPPVVTGIYLDRNERMKKILSRPR